MLGSWVLHQLEGLCMEFVHGFCCIRSAHDQQQMQLTLLLRAIVKLSNRNNIVISPHDRQVMGMH